MEPVRAGIGSASRSGRSVQRPGRGDDVTVLLFPEEALRVDGWTEPLTAAGAILFRIAEESDHHASILTQNAATLQAQADELIRQSRVMLDEASRYGRQAEVLRRGSLGLDAAAQVRSSTDLDEVPQVNGPPE